jgi:hypothetical protein
MHDSVVDRCSPLGLFHGQSTSGLYDRVVGLLGAKPYNRRTKEVALRSPRRIVRQAILVAGIFAIAASNLAPAATPQRPAKPLTQQEVINLLKGDVPPPRIEELVHERGVVFSVTITAEKELRAAGATGSLLTVLRAAGPRSSPSKRTPNPPEHGAQPPVSPPGEGAAAPVLVLQSSPGGAAVHLDDEPIGTTSGNGVLRRTHLLAGNHALRVSLAGYQDFQESIELHPGETLRVTAKLIAASTEVASPPGAFRAPEVRPGDAYFPALGIVTPESQPEDYTVVDVMEVAPGSPAEGAGLHSSCTILSLAGVRVTSPQHLQQVLSQHRAGETVEITFNDGSLVHSARVHLASNTPAPR